MNATETTDVLIVGSGFGGSITAYHLAAGGAKVTVLERGPWLNSEEFDHDFKFGSSATRVFDFVVGDGMSVLGGNCVGGGSVVYFATMPRAPRFVFERHGSIGRRMWPAAIDRDALEPWYDRVAEALPVTPTSWDEVPYIGGVFAAACKAAGHTANPSPSAVDTSLCTNCNWMMSGCRFDAKRSLLLNYLPAALSHGAEIRPLHEVQKITKLDTGDYRVHYNTIDEVDYRQQTGSGTIDAKIVILAAGTAATPVILQRSEPELGRMPHAVGRYFSGNGERLNTAVLEDDKVRELLGLSRDEANAYGAYQIGRGPVVASWDRLDGDLPEYERFSLEQLYFPRASAPSWPRCRMRRAPAGTGRRRRRCCASGAPGLRSSPCRRTTTRACSARRRPPATRNGSLSSCSASAACATGPPRTRCAAGRSRTRRSGTSSNTTGWPG